MRPPIVQVTAAYGAGLWVGLVVSVPQPLGLAAVVVALAAGGVLGWPGIVGGGAGVGVLTGAVAEARRGTACAGGCSGWHLPGAERVAGRARAGARWPAPGTLRAAGRAGPSPRATVRRPRAVRGSVGPGTPGRSRSPVAAGVRGRRDRASPVYLRAAH